MLLIDLLLKNLLIWPKTLLFYDLLIKNSDFGKSLNIWSASRCWKTNQTKKKKLHGCYFSLITWNWTRKGREKKSAGRWGEGGHHLVTNTLNYVK